LEEAIYDAIYGASAAAFIAAGVNVAQISGDSVAADNLETMLDGTGGQVLSLGQLNIVASGGNSAIVATGNGAGHGILATGGGTDGSGIKGIGGATNGNGIEGVGTGLGSGLKMKGGATGHGIWAQSGGGSASGIYAEGGATGFGIEAKGGYTSGAGIRASGESGNSVGIEAIGIGTQAGIKSTGGVTGHGVEIVGGATSGDGINSTTTDGTALNLSSGGSHPDLEANGIIPGTVDTTGFSPTTVEFECDDITEATASHYNDRVVMFLTGVLKDQAKPITAYSLVSGRGHFTVDAFTEAPGNNDVCILI